MTNSFDIKYDDAYEKIQRGFETKTQDDVMWVYAKSFDDYGIKHGVTARYGGVSSDETLASLNFNTKRNDTLENVYENKKRLAQAVGFSNESMILDNYEHGDVIEQVGKSDVGRGWYRDLPKLPYCDGLITNEKAVTLTTLHADCMPVFLYDPVTASISGIHSGWKGTSLRVVAGAIAKMSEFFGANPKDILVAIGPSISQKYFEVDEPVYNIFMQEFPTVQASYFKEENQKYHIDLWKIMVAQCVDADVQPENITLAEICSYQNTDFYSYRRDKDGCGGMMGFITLG